MITRIITGVVGIVLAAFIIQTGGWVFGAAVLLLSLIGWHEYARAFSHKGLPLSYFSGMAALFFFWGCAWKGNAEEFAAVSTAAIFWVLSLAVFQHRHFSVEQACASVAGIVYIGLAFSHLVLLRFFDDEVLVNSPAGPMQLGCAFVWLALIGTWASDTFAYFTGSCFGRTKLCEAISPKKTVEGFIGGVIGTTLAVMLVGWSFSFSVPMMALLGVSIALVATMGDLVESAVKRYTGIKDSGSLIPGHGGVLDRFDSVMFTAPFVYYFVQIFHIAG